MKRLAILFRKLRAAYRVRALEIRLHDNFRAGDQCRDPEAMLQNSIARRILRRELVHARMRLAEFDRPGQRRTYDIA